MRGTLDVTFGIRVAAIQKTTKMCKVATLLLEEQDRADELQMEKIEAFTQLFILYPRDPPVVGCETEI